MAMEFKKAQRKQSKLRLATSGPSGAGKTYSALKIAFGMGGKIAVIDTERGSASKYDHLGDFDVLDLEPPYNPERFIEAIHAAEKAGYDIIVIDSATHEWDGAGGCLELNEKIAVAKYKGNTWSAWSETTPRHRAFIDAILQSKCHIIVTMRSKTDTVQEGGKVKKVGMKDVQRDGTDYEFDVVLNLTHEGHYATVGKDRTGLFAGDPKPITEATGKMLIEWLNSGAPVAKEVSAAADAQSIYEKGESRLHDATTLDDLKQAFGYIHSNKTVLSDEQYAGLVTLKDVMKANIAG